MWDMMFWLLILALAAVIIVLGGVAARSFLSGQSPSAAFFGAKADPRIYVTEQASIDGRRRLLLIRRDDVEHLVMTGGPVDVVIETNIRDGVSVPLHVVDADRAPAKAFTTAESQARAFGQRPNGTDL
jgi:flagellar protein FliO/FliZ